jgi:hypothetical protein
MSRGVLAWPPHSTGVLPQSLATHQKLELCSPPDAFGRQVYENFLLCGWNFG